jgi:hypothetical protein
MIRDHRTDIWSVTVATKLQQQFGNEPKDKEIIVELMSGLGGSARPAFVQFPTIQSVWERSFGIQSFQKIALRITLTRFRFVLAVTFPSSGPVQVSADVIGADIQGLQIHQPKEDFVQANIVHVPSGFGGNSSDECTVSCADGTSRSGMGACIDCPGPRGTVRFCC